MAGHDIPSPTAESIIGRRNVSAIEMTRIEAPAIRISEKLHESLKN
jgi:hypothetical protein